MDTYIIRIYRRDNKTDRLLVGVVEEAGASGKRGFTSFDELREILEDPNKTGGGAGGGRQMTDRDGNGTAVTPRSRPLP